MTGTGNSDNIHIQCYFNKFSFADNQILNMSKKPAKVKNEKKDKNEIWDVAQLKTIGSPVDISLAQCAKHLCPSLELQYYDAMPISLEMINTGSTGWVFYRTHIDCQLVK